MDETLRMHVLDATQLLQESQTRKAVSTEESQQANEKCNPTIWSANISTVFCENFREQKLKRSSNDGPNKSITMTL